MNLPRAGARMDVVPFALRLIVGSIFLLAGVDKLQAPAAFADAVRAFHILPASLVLPFAFIVPPIEILIGVYLVLGLMTRLAAGAAAVMLGVFVLALLTSIATGNTAHACGCFGAAAGNPVLVWLEGGSTVTWWDVARDLGLGLMAGVVTILGPGTLTARRFTTASRPAAPRRGGI